MPYKIGTYVRVSTEEQAQVIDGSLESQQHRLKSFVQSKNLQEKNWGKIVDTYIDDGFSAKDTRRPAYQRMLRDIRNGKINLILVTDFSRLSRNIPDFCGLLEELGNHKAKFLSVKEQFDTSTPIGEMMVYNMINLAQFERKQTSERISMNFNSRALRGLLNGGNPILGYDKDPTNPGKLLVNAQEAPAARKVFSLYLETCSLQQTAAHLNTSSIGPKLGKGRKSRHAVEGRWTIGSVRNLLTNYSYVGKREVNRKNKTEEQDTLKPWQRYKVVTAAWPAIVSEKDFTAVQKLLEENWKKERSRISDGDRRFFPLSGVLRCGDCGRALIGQTSHGRNQPHRYYGHKFVGGETTHCHIKRFRADELEDVVVTHLSEILLRAGHLESVETNIRKTIETKGADLFVERDRVQREITAADSSIDSALKLMGQVSTNPDVINLVQEKLEKLATAKKQLTTEHQDLLSKIERINDAKESRYVIEENARNFKKGWLKANQGVKRRLIRRLIECLVYTREGLHAYYVTSNESLNTQPIPPAKMASESSSGAIPNNLCYLQKYRQQPPRLISDKGVLSLRKTGGAGSRTRVREASVLRRATCLVVVLRMIGRRPTTNC